MTAQPSTLAAGKPDELEKRLEKRVKIKNLHPQMVCYYYKYSIITALGWAIDKSEN